MDHSSSQLLIIHWNARSLYTNLLEFKIYLYLKKPHLVCITESWLIKSRNPTFINYVSYRKDRHNARGGGMLILCRADISHSLININPFHPSNLEFQAIRLNFSSHSIDILSIYNPQPRIQFHRELDSYISQLGRNALVCGDFNARHRTWDINFFSPPTLPAQKFFEYILGSAYSLVTPCGLNTRYDKHLNIYSTIDLTLASPSIIDTVSVQTGRDLGSDHLPILVQFDLIVSTYSYEKRPSWKLSSANWTQWTNFLPTLPESISSIDEDINIFSNSLTTAANTVFGLTSTHVHPKYNRSWWSAECSKQVALRHKARRFYEREPTLYNKILLNKQCAITRRTIRQHKRSSWRKFASKINHRTPVATVWKAIKSLKGNSLNNSYSIINNNTPIYNIEDKVELFGKSLGEIVSQLSDIAIAKLEIDEQVTIASEDNSADYNCSFTLHELRSSIQEYCSGKGLAIGHDTVHKSFLSHLNSKHELYLLNLFNRIWESGLFPSTWKKALVIPVAKPGQDLSNVLSYRPISLLSCLGKLYEKLLYRRLYWHLETNNLFPSTQCGFRVQHSTIDQLVRLETFIRVGLRERQHVIVIFFDLSKAFDTVSHDGLLYKLVQIGIGGRMLQALRDYFKNRTFQIVIGNTFSRQFYIKRGVPQGSILSTLGYNIYTSDVPKVKEVNSSEFADDTAFYVTANTLAEAEINLQIQVDMFEKWCKDWGLTINVQKTKVLHFHNTKSNIKPCIRLSGTTVDVSSNYKFLGLIFDSPRLTWARQIK